MGRGLSRQQRAILDVLPISENGAVEGVFGITIEEIAVRSGKMSVHRLDDRPEVRALQMKLGIRDGQLYITRSAYYSTYRALRSLHRRGLVIVRHRPGQPTRWIRAGQ